jgi:transposase
MRHEGRIRSIETDRLLRRPAHPCNTLTMVKDQVASTLDCWLHQAEASALASFAAGLRRDEDALRAALTEPWSNGQVEGQVNRLKVIKREMYGRAGFELLRCRVLAHA